MLLPKLTRSTSGRLRARERWASARTLTPWRLLVETALGGGERLRGRTQTPGSLFAPHSQTKMSKMGNLPGLRRLSAEGWMIVPTMVVLLAVSIYPFAYMLYMSTIEYSPLPQVPPSFIGLGNWTEMLMDRDIWNSWLTTVWYFGGALSLELVLGVLVALLIER